MIRNIVELPWVWTHGKYECTHYELCLGLHLRHAKQRERAQQKKAHYETDQAIING